MGLARRCLQKTLALYGTSLGSTLTAVGSPLFGSDLDKIYRVCRTVAEMRKAETEGLSLHDYLRFTRKMGLGPTQKDGEIISLLEAASGLPLLSVLEIGTADGGTFHMLCRAAAPTATLVTIDLRNEKKKTILLKALARNGQKVHLIRGDSHDDRTARKVMRILGAMQLDLLLIDGDHSWDGVKKDFEIYSRLVRKGGIIAFHDIVPDHRTRYGVETSGCSGDVPRFWNMIKTERKSQEFVEQADQDGMGIGMIQWL